MGCWAGLAGSIDHVEPHAPAARRDLLRGPSRHVLGHTVRPSCAVPNDMDISLAGGRESAIEEGSLEAGYLQDAPPVAAERRTLSGERWVPDVEAVRCEACTAKFGFWRRRVRTHTQAAQRSACRPPRLSPASLAQPRGRVSPHCLISGADSLRLHSTTAGAVGARFVAGLTLFLWGKDAPASLICH